MQILKSFNRSMLLHSNEEQNTIGRTLRTLLASDKSTAEMLDFIFDRKRLEHESKHLLKLEETEC